MGAVGATLKEARMRRGVELAEIESATKIRTPFLLAIEAEDWDALPGDAYTRGFVRAYADQLGLDGARLAAECPVTPTPPAPTATTSRGRSGRIRAAALAAGLIVLIAVLGLIWSPGGGDEQAGPDVPPGSMAGPPPQAGPDFEQPEPASTPDRMGPTELTLTTTGEVWVCLQGDGGEALINGVVLPGGVEEGPFRSDSFTVSLGNGEAAMRVDGKEIDIPESASPLGYEIGRGGELTPLSESERPTCT